MKAQKSTMKQWRAMRRKLSRRFPSQLPLSPWWSYMRRVPRGERRLIKKAEANHWYGRGWANAWYEQDGMWSWLFSRPGCSHVVKDEGSLWKESYIRRVYGQ